MGGMSDETTTSATSILPVGVSVHGNAGQRGARSSATAHLPAGSKVNDRVPVGAWVGSRRENPDGTVTFDHGNGASTTYF